MSARAFSLASLAALVALTGCVQFQSRQLYSGLEPAPVPERPRTLALAVEPEIYADADDDTVWFQEDARCTQGAVTSDVVYDGQRAVAVTWDRNVEGCEWAGLGFGWDNWVGKDLSEVFPYAAIQMRVRSAEGRMYGLPIVLTLEDYAGGMGFAYTANQYFERPFIDEEWQTVTVPLADFDLSVENLDPTNVKQLMFELQQSGSLYLDDIRLVWYEAEEQEPWLVEPERPDPTALPITLFDDAFINDDGWGLVTDVCQSVELTSTDPASGAVALRLRWDTSQDRCFRGSAGVSWDQWYPVDVTPIADAAAIQFQARLASGSAPSVPLQIGLEDYGKRVSSAPLSATFAASGSLTTEWQTVTIPFAALDGDADLANVKQLVMLMDGAGEVFLDDIRLVRR
ncbi:MAG TPA: hypothetical protein EYQ24_16745 [Bacteroidetes bacterium]|nr:hypothetical protein [Bacteroidota bacterium]